MEPTPPRVCWLVCTALAWQAPGQRLRALCHEPHERAAARLVQRQASVHGPHATRLEPEPRPHPRPPLSRPTLRQPSTSLLGPGCCDYTAVLSVPLPPFGLCSSSQPLAARARYAMPGAGYETWENVWGAIPSPRAAAAPAPPRAAIAYSRTVWEPRPSRAVSPQDCTSARALAASPRGPCCAPCRRHVQQAH